MRRALAVLLVVIAVLPAAGCLVEEERPGGGGGNGPVGPFEGTTRGFRLPDVAFTDHTGAAGSLWNVSAAFTILHMESPIVNGSFLPQYSQIRHVRQALSNLTIAAITLSVDPRSTPASMAALRTLAGSDWTVGVALGDANRTLSLRRFPTVFLLDRDKVVLNRSDEPLGEGRIIDAIQATWGQRPGPGVGPAVGQRAPEMVFRDVDGNEGSLGTWRGQVVLVEVWEIECPWCIEQFHELANLSVNYSSRGLRLLSIDVVNWETDDMVKAVAVQAGATWPFAVDGDNVQSRYDVWRVPTLLLIDRQGVVRWTTFGYSPYATLADEVERLI
jgi:thiol-disulfide isomerase/thioredoxin